MSDTIGNHSFCSSYIRLSDYQTAIALIPRLSANGRITRLLKRKRQLKEESQPPSIRIQQLFTYLSPFTITIHLQGVVGQLVCKVLKRKDIGAIPCSQYGPAGVYDYPAPQPLKL